MAPIAAFAEKAMTGLIRAFFSDNHGPHEVFSVHETSEAHSKNMEHYERQGDIRE
jgi:hypothetical protein